MYKGLSLFSFISDPLPTDTFGVVSFHGTEGISKPYEFDINLVSENPSIDLEAIMQQKVRFIIHREERDDVVYNGMLASFEQLQRVDDYTFYRAHLVPKLWWLSITEHLQVILNKSVPDIISDVLKDGGFSSTGFELRLMNTYDPIEYVCQYGESHLNFISRWCEKDGIYYYFEQMPKGERVVFTDISTTHQDFPQGKTLSYEPPSGLDTLHKGETIKSFTCRHIRMPEKILLKDYNYQRPSLDITGNADVDPKGQGTVYSYNVNFTSPEEGKRLARIKAESMLCRKACFFGESSVPYMMPGFTFSLAGHYRQDFNEKYLVTETEHEGNQTGYIISGTGIEPSEQDFKPYYRNSFTAIPSHIQFRPEARIKKPRISGSIVARIDSTESGRYAELDDQGRYKISLPFDLSNHEPGKGSAWVRMAQPYAGSNHGIHFPLHKDTEVLLAFIDGDPDRPVIAAAVPNVATPSPVNASNQTMNVIQTKGQNRIAIEDQSGSERMLFQSPKADSFIRIGTPNDPDKNDKKEPPDYYEIADTDGVAIKTKGALDIKVGLKNELVVGESTETYGISEIFTVLGAPSRFQAVMSFDIRAGGSICFTPLHRQLRGQVIDIGDQAVQIRGNRVRVTEGLVKIHGNDTRVDGKATHIRGDYTKVMGDVANIIGDETYVAGNTNKVDGNETVIGNTVNEVSGTVTKISGKVNIISGNVTTVSADENLINGRVTTVSGDANEVVANSIHITSQNNTIVGNMTLV